jgi:hypothetical protein
METESYCTGEQVGLIFFNASCLVSVFPFRVNHFDNLSQT